MNKSNWKIKLGIGLMIFSVPLFLFLPAIPFLTIEGAAKIKLTTVIFISAEITFWAGGLLVGKELFTKYKAYFNPKNWFKKSETPKIK
jgi:hypothetical protein